jgi:hypothetical protein
MVTILTGLISTASGVSLMVDRMIAVTLVSEIAFALYSLLTIAQRACERRSRRHWRYANWYASAARGCRKQAEWSASRAERATGPRTRAFYRMASQSLPRDAVGHDNESKRQSRRARFWDFMA